MTSDRGAHNPFVGVRSVLALLTCAGLAACTVGPNYDRPNLATPNSYGATNDKVPQAPEAEVAPRGTITTAEVPLEPGALANWWEQLNDPTLSSLVKEGMAANMDLRLAVERLREARALRGIAAADAYPNVDATAGASRSRGSDNLDGGFPTAGDDVTNFNVGLDASWEIDVFGRVRRSVEAADADIDVSRENMYGVMVAVAAEVADAYVEYRVLARRLEIVKGTIAAQRDTVGLTNTRLDAGIANELEVSQAQAQLASRQAQLPVLQAAQRRAENRLALVLGRAPGQPISELADASQLDALPKSMTQVPIGMPSELLRRRPDLRQAEREVAAATARVGVATADLYPRFSLTGSFGFSSGEVGSLLEADSRVWDIGPSMRWSIFNAGRVRANIDAADSRTRQSLLRYERSVLVALREVEDSLVNLAYEQDRQSALARTLESSRRSATLADDRYRGGVGNFLDVLDAQRAAFDAEDQLAASRGDSLRALIALYKALGGGWPEDLAVDRSEQAQARLQQAQALNPNATPGAPASAGPSAD